MDIHTLNEEIKTWLHELGKIIKSFNDYDTKEKDDFRDLVSDVDIAVEKELIKKINQLSGNHTILAEEKSNEDVDFSAEHLWVLDPIDGTSNFLKQKKDFGIIIAYFYKGEPTLSYLFDVAENEIVSAIKNEGIFVNGIKQKLPENSGIHEAFIAIDSRKMYQTEIFKYCAKHAFDLRFLGSSIADGLRVIKGQYGASLNSSSEPWDRAPFLLFAQESGLLMCQFNGEPTTLKGIETYYFGTKQIYSDIFQQ